MTAIRAAKKHRSPSLPLPVLVAGAAVVAVLLGAIFVIVAMMSPDSTGHMLDSHTSTGSMGITVVSLAFGAMFLVLLFAIPVSILKLVKSERHRSVASYCIVAIGATTMVLLGWAFVVVLADRM